MGKLFTTEEVADFIGVTTTTITTTIREWERLNLIPQATRIGLRRVRRWSKAKVELILEFARDNGYIVKPLEGVQNGR
jgi:DNA-binding transcriptional MerR regulator